MYKRQRFSIALIAPLMYAFAFFTDSSTGNPFARFAATALESVQPVSYTHLICGQKKISIILLTFFLNLFFINN